jgi:hypothetical protein
MPISILLYVNTNVFVSTLYTVDSGQLAELAGLASWRRPILGELARFGTWVAQLAAGGLAPELAVFWLWLAGLAGLAPARHVPVILLM